MACYATQLLLICSLTQVGTKGEDHLKLGQLDSPANATFSELVANMGLYSLGQVENDGYFISACAINGKMNNSGILLFYVIRELNGIWNVQYNFEITFSNTGQKCRSIFDNSLAPKQNDFIAVFVGSNITLIKDGKRYQPIQIAFEKKGADNSMFKYFDGSNSFSDEEYKINDFNERVQRIIQGQHPHERLSPSRYRLNVEVTIVVGSTSNNKLAGAVAALSVTVALLVLTNTITTALICKVKNCSRKVLLQMERENQNDNGLRPTNGISDSSYHYPLVPYTPIPEEYYDDAVPPQDNDRSINVINCEPCQAYSKE